MEALVYNWSYERAAGVSLQPFLYLRPMSFGSELQIKKAP